MSAPDVSTLLRTLEQGIESLVFPGATAALVRDHGRSMDLLAAGAIAKDGPETTPDTLYDIASLTKPFVALAAVRLWMRGVIDPTDPVRRWLPEWNAPGASGARLEHLLAHEAGLPAWRPFFEDVPAAERETAAGQERIRRAALGADLETLPGERMVYSDLGFMLLGWVLERASGIPLDVLIHREVLEPLDLSGTTFRPLKRPGSAGHAIAPTEFCPWRRRLLQGEVHDENAWTMGGVAPHAGLFSTARDMAALTASLLQACNGARAWVEPARFLASVTRRPLGRTLGWDTPEPEGSSAGASISRAAFGHLGFTGCSIWLDPARGVGSVLLSNRVHPTRANNAIRAFRPLFHEACFGRRGPA